MNDIYSSVQDGNLENYYDLEDYLSYRGYREGFYGSASMRALTKSTTTRQTSFSVWIECLRC